MAPSKAVNLAENTARSSALLSHKLKIASLKQRWCDLHDDDESTDGGDADAASCDGSTASESPSASFQADVPETPPPRRVISLADATAAVISLADATEPPASRSVFSSVQNVNYGFAQGRSTLMLRNVPNDFDNSMIIKLFNREGFAGRYDFVYLPIDFHSEANLGYVFVNLVTPQDAERFWCRFEGFTDWKVRSGKVGSVTWGAVQGLEENVRRYRNSPVMHESIPLKFKPMIFQDGIQGQFPRPTRTPTEPNRRPAAPARKPRGSKNSVSK